MRNALTALILCLCASLLLNISSTVFADARPASGPDEKNFIYYVDVSGSMSMRYHERQSSKIDVAMKLLHAINDEMPDINANVGVYTFGQHLEYRRVEPFDRDALTEAFNQIPTDFKFTGRLTAMGSGIQNLDTTIEALPGSVEFIVISDGEANAGDPPEVVIQDVYDRYGDRVCFHFISLARKSGEKAFIRNLSKMNACSISVEAVDLLDESTRADFMEKVFVK